MITLHSILPLTLYPSTPAQLTKCWISLPSASIYTCLHYELCAIILSYTSYVLCPHPPLPYPQFLFTHWGVHILIYSSAPSLLTYKYFSGSYVLILRSPTLRISKHWRLLTEGHLEVEDSLFVWLDSHPIHMFSDSELWEGKGEWTWSWW